MVIPFETFRIHMNEARATRRRVVVAPGMFDLLHVGHLHHLQEAKSYGDLLVVLLADDAHVRSVKGPSRPIMPFEERAELLAALRPVDYVVAERIGMAETLIRAATPKFCARGCDRTRETVPETALVESLGGKMVFTSGPKHSTTDIVVRIRSMGEMGTLGAGL